MNQKLLLGLLIVALLPACIVHETPVRRERASVEVHTWTNQPIERAIDLRPGMTEHEVVNVMGAPITRDFQGDGAALQWCKTGAVRTKFPLDRYVIGFFYKGKLVGVRNYQNHDNKAGDCSILYKTIEWKPSDKIIEYRFK